MVFAKAFGSGDDHGPHCVGPAGVAVVVDFNPARGARQRERFLQGAQQLLLRRCVRKLARECFARIGQGVLHQLLAFAALRRAHLDFVPGFGRQRFGKQCSLVKIMRNENEARRRLVVVELREKCAEHFRRTNAAVGLREIGAVPPVLARAEKEHFDA